MHAHLPGFAKGANAKAVQKSLQCGNPLPYLTTKECHMKKSDSCPNTHMTYHKLQNYFQKHNRTALNRTFRISVSSLRYTFETVSGPYSLYLAFGACEVPDFPSSNAVNLRGVRNTTPTTAASGMIQQKKVAACATMIVTQHNTTWTARFPGRTEFRYSGSAP